MLNSTGILLSGGMDSIALAYWKKPRYAFTVDYGQKPAKAEIQAATQVAETLRMEHKIIKIDCSSLGSGDMAGSNPNELAPITEWWPYRNQLIITLAAMKAITLGVKKLYMGSVSTDLSHKDGTSVFFEFISQLMQFQEGNLEVMAPSINMNTTELINTSKVPTSLLFWAHSCHKSNTPCMHCNGCKKYLHTLQEIGINQ